jgi:hypothetical protein
MKRNILSPRSGLLVTLLLLVSILSATSVSAKSYKLNGDMYLSLNQPGNHYWNLSDIVPDTLHLTIKLITTDKTLALYPSGNIVVAPDSNGQKYLGMVLTYSGNTAVVSTSYIVIDDNNGSFDSIIIQAQDDRFHNSSRPFHFFATAPAKYTADSTMYFYYTQSKVTIPLQAANYSGSPINVTVGLANSTGNFSLDETSFTIGASGGAVGTHNFQLNFERTTGHSEDSVIILMHGNGLTDTMRVLAIDSMREAIPYIPNDTLFFFDQTFGTTKCGYLHIKNPYNFPITITKFTWYGSGANFKSTTTWSLPKTIDANSSDSVDVCFTAPSTYGLVDAYELQIEYSGPGTNTATGAFAAIGTTKACFTLNTTVPAIFDNNHQFESTIVGGHTDMNLVYTNNTDREITVTDVFHKSQNGNGNDFLSVVSPSSLPVKIAAGKEFNVTLRFAPTQAIARMGFIWGLHLLAGSDSLCNLSETYYGYGYILTGDDTDAHTLFPSQMEVLPMQSEKNSTTKSFHFVNNGAVNLKVTGVALADGTHFTISSPKQSDLPITVKVGDALDVDLTFDANSNGFYTDSLIITTDKAATTIPYHIQAVRTGVAGVDMPIASPIVISIVPNPAETATTITTSGIEYPMMQLFDELGNNLGTRSAATWQLTVSGATCKLAAGNYFVRVSGIDTNGKPVVQTKRLVIR